MIGPKIDAIPTPSVVLEPDEIISGFVRVPSLGDTFFGPVASQVRFFSVWRTRYARMSEYRQVVDTPDGRRIMVPYVPVGQRPHVGVIMGARNYRH